MRTYILLILCCLLFCSVDAFNDINELLSKINQRPPTQSGRPLEVKLGIYLESIGNFRSTEMSFDVDAYVYMSWKDVRLRHLGPDYVLVNNKDAKKQMWVPDLYFANARQATFQEVMVPNFNIFIAPNGQVAFSLRCTLTVACSLDLRFYPMDHQVCSIRVLSYAYIANQVNVTWFRENAIRVNPEVGLPEFQINKLAPNYCNGTYRYALMKNSYKKDDFSCLSGSIYLSRSLGYNILQSYIPTSMIVMISWVSFWIDRRAVPARVTLSFTTLVSFTTLGNGMRFGLAQVSYAKAIDLWYGVCLLFVFMALLEFALINNYMRKSDKYEHLARRVQEEIHRKGYPHLEASCNARNTSSPIGSIILGRKNFSGYNVRNKEQSMGRHFSIISADFDKERINVATKRRTPIYNQNNGNSDEDNSWSELFSKYKKEMQQNEDDDKDTLIFFQRQSKRESRKALRIDQISRFGFPIVFTLFNILYWWYYLVYKVTVI